MLAADDRRREWATVAVVAGLWALLIGTGLGSTPLIILGGLCFVAAALFASMAGILPFALLSFAVAAIGMSMVIIAGHIDVSVGSLIGAAVTLATISGRGLMNGTASIRKPETPSSIQKPMIFRISAWTSGWEVLRSGWKSSVTVSGHPSCSQ